MAEKKYYKNIGLKCSLIGDITTPIGWHDPNKGTSKGLKHGKIKELGDAVNRLLAADITIQGLIAALQSQVDGIELFTDEIPQYVMVGSTIHFSDTTYLGGTGTSWTNTGSAIRYNDLFDTEEATHYQVVWMINSSDTPATSHWRIVDIDDSENVLAGSTVSISNASYCLVLGTMSAISNMTITNRHQIEYYTTNGGYTARCHNVVINFYKQIYS